MNYKTLIVMMVFALLIKSVFNWDSGQVALSAALSPTGPDLYIKDTPSDTGTEPNSDRCGPDLCPMYVTEDIWVRATADPNYQPYPFPEAAPTWTPLPHEEPQYRDPKLSRPNYVSAASGSESTGEAALLGLDDGSRTHDPIVGQVPPIFATSSRLPIQASSKPCCYV